VQSAQVLACQRPKLLFGYVRFQEGFPTPTRSVGMDRQGDPDSDLISRTFKLYLQLEQYGREWTLMELVDANLKTCTLRTYEPDSRWAPGNHVMAVA